MLEKLIELMELIGLMKLWECEHKEQNVAPNITHNRDRRPTTADRRPLKIDNLQQRPLTADSRPLTIDNSQLTTETADHSQ